MILSLGEGETSIASLALDSTSGRAAALGAVTSGCTGSADS